MYKKDVIDHFGTQRAVAKAYTFIPNSFLERLLKQEFSVDQFSEILKVFREGR